MVLIEKDEEDEARVLYIAVSLCRRSVRGLGKEEAEEEEAGGWRGLVTRSRGRNNNANTTRKRGTINTHHATAALCLPLLLPLPIAASVVVVNGLPWEHNLQTTDVRGSSAVSPNNSSWLRLLGSKVGSNSSNSR